MNSEQRKTWRSAIYIRISKENGEDTLKNQRTIVADHLRMLGNIEICSIKVDDGYTGLNSNRPAFQDLLHEIRHGQIDCIAVRDLSRLSRNYIEAGRYIQDMFPNLGVRFISVFEGFDFVKAPEYNVAMMIGFRNIVNEDYSRNLSQSVKNSISRGHAEGKHLGAFTVYGYKKSLIDRYRLEPDPESAKIVRDIFLWKLEGMSAAVIAESLNRMGIPSPAEYKKASNFHTSFQKNVQAKWTPVAVGRILSNKVYTGCLEQGKSIKPYLKINYRKKNPSSEWVCVDNTHEAIIPKTQFEAVARLLAMDTRCSPNQKTLTLLAGFIRCNNCGQNMIQKQKTSNGKTYLYYVCCGKNQEKRSCSEHRILKSKLEEAVSRQVDCRIENVKKIDKMIPTLNMSRIAKNIRQESIQKLGSLINELEQNQEYLKKLHSEFALKELSNDDFDFMRKHYRQKCDIIEEQIQAVEAGLCEKFSADTVFGWIEQYRPFFTVEGATRPMLAYLVRRITVDGSKKVWVEFLHEREYEVLLHAINYA